MDGKGRCLDNVFVERLWRTVKYEDIYLKDTRSVYDLNCGLARYFDFYSDHPSRWTTARRGRSTDWGDQ